MFSRFMILTIFMLSLASCGSKKATVPVKLRLFQSAITSGSVLNGGVLLIGRSEDGQHSFRMGVNNAESGLTLELMKGRWEFAAIAWEGGTAGNMMGANRCATTGIVDLKDNEASVNFDLTQATCAASFRGNNFSEAAYLYSGSMGDFYNFYPIPCFVPTNGNLASCHSSVNPSTLTHYKIIFKAHSKGDVVGSTTPLTSGCFPVMLSPYAKVPMSAAGAENPFGFSVAFYKSSDCSEIATTIDFHSGPLYNSSNLVHDFTSTGNFTYFRFSPNQIFNKQVPDTYGLSAFTTNNTVLRADGKYYTNNPVVNFTISGATSMSAYQMCITEESSCPAANWRPIASSGTFNMSSVSGLHTLKLYYKNGNGDVSATFKTTEVTLLLTAPYVTPFAVADYSADIGFNWDGNLMNNYIYDTTNIKICDSPSCTVVYYEDNTRIALDTGSYVTTTPHIKANMVAGNMYYAKLTAIDMFGMPTYLSWSNFMLSYNHSMP